MLIEVARVAEVGSSEAGSSGEVSLLEKVVLVLLAVEAGAIKEGSRFLLSTRILGRAITRVLLRRMPSRRLLSRRVYCVLCGEHPISKSEFHASYFWLASQGAPYQTRVLKNLARSKTGH